MSEDANAQFVNKYIQVLRSKFDTLQSDVLNMEVQNIFLRESLLEKDEKIRELDASIYKLEHATQKKETKSDQVKGEKVGG